MAAQIGTSRAQTTALGRMLERTTETRNQTAMCVLTDGPSSIKERTARRLSNPVISQVAEIMLAPKSKTTMSEKYRLVIELIGTRVKRALTAIGSSAVTPGLTGILTHHHPIQSIVPTAVRVESSRVESGISPRQRANRTGPQKR